MKTAEILRRRRWAWGLVFSWTLVIYLTLAVARDIWEYFQDIFGAPTLSIATIIAFAVSGVLILLYVALYEKQRRLSAYIALVVIAGIYAFFLTEVKSPVERVHFLEYGVLGLLVYRAISTDVKNRYVYLWSALVVFGFGFIDEVIQGILPKRYYDVRDIMMNGAGGVLALALIGFVGKRRGS